jgi:hypothetical protein
MRDVIATTLPNSLEFRPMLYVDCPLCDAPAPFDTTVDAMDCPACAVRLELAPAETRELAVAA